VYNKCVILLSKWVTLNAGPCTYVICGLQCSAVTGFPLSLVSRWCSILIFILILFLSEGLAIEAWDVQTAMFFLLSGSILHISIGTICIKRVNLTIVHFISKGILGNFVRFLLKNRPVGRIIILGPQNILSNWLS
jgi:hypothetical protein